MTNYHNGIFQSGGPKLPPPPDDLTIPQFILDSQHPLRQLRLGEHLDKPWLIDDQTGKAYGLEEIRARTFGLANGIADRWKIRDDDVVCVFSPNHIDYPILIWATHRLGAIASCANPAYTDSELEYQLRATKATLLVTHTGGLPIAIKAARAAGLTSDRIILLPPIASPTPPAEGFVTVNELVETGLKLDGNPRFEEKRLKSGENQKKIAFLSFSSGTTGRPKAVAIPHYSVISNILQFAAFNHSNDPSVPYEQRRFRAGEDITTAVLPFFHIYGLVVNLHVSLFSGLGIVVFPKFSWVDFLESIVKYRITHMFIVPPQVVLFVKHPATKKYDLSRLRYCMAGAAPLSPELTVQFQKVVPNCFVGQGYDKSTLYGFLVSPCTELPLSFLRDYG
ncbi:hypothetical protein FRC03_004672 [Tulasnella sp. 419]|nr:hypothetical protein FRC03_004672 [Tulasnella sp. 419]